MPMFNLTPSLFFLVVAETENFKSNSLIESRCFARVVFPLPDGAHNIITLPAIKEYLKFALLFFQEMISFQLHYSEFWSYLT